MSKSGSYDHQTGLINWTIVVNPNEVDITDAVLTDEMFANAVYQNNVAVTIEPTEGCNVVWKDNHIAQMTFKKVNGQPNTKKYTITYSTKAEGQWGQETTVKNHANLDPDPDDPDDDVPGDGEVIISGGSISKDNNGIQFAPNGDGKTGTITWIVTIDVPAGGLPAGTVIKDTMSGNHWMTWNQIVQWSSKLKWGRNQGTETPYFPKKDIEFICLDDGKPYSFEYINTHNSEFQNKRFALDNITLTEAMASPDGKANTLTITYTTTVDMNEINNPATGDVIFTNKVNIGDKEGSSSETYTKPKLEKTDGSDQPGTEENPSYTSNEDGKLTWKVKLTTDSQDHTSLTITDKLLQPEYVKLDVPGGIVLDSGCGIDMPITIAEDGTISGKANSYQVKPGSSYNKATGEIKLTLTADPEGGKIPSNGKQYVFTFNCHVDKEKLEADLKTQTGGTGLVSGVTYKRFTNSVSAKLDTTDLPEKTQTQQWTYKEKERVFKTDGNGQTSQDKNTPTSSSSEDGTVVWKVKVTPRENKPFTIVDTLPPDVTLVSISASGGSGGWPNKIEIGADGKVSGVNANYSIDGNYVAGSGDQNGSITLKVEGKDTPIEPEKEYEFTFTCKVKDEYMSDGKPHRFTNSVTVKVDDTPIGSSEQTQEWKRKKPTDETRVVDKTGSWDDDNRLLKYSITINPEAKDLVEGTDTLSLTDTLTFNSKIHYDNNHKEAEMDVTLVPSMVKLYPAIQDANGAWVADTSNEIQGWSWTRERIPRENDPYDMKVDVVLHVTGIPDGRPLVFQYAYQATTTLPKNESINLPVSNKASLDGTSYEDDDNRSQDKWDKEESSSGITTGKSYTFYKVEQGNYGKNLAGAEFSVLRYNPDTKKFEPTGIEPYFTTEAGVFSIEWDETKYERNVLYAVVETKAPVGYILPDPAPLYYYFFSDTEEEEVVTRAESTVPEWFPAEAKDSVVDLSKHAKTTYAENILNETELTVNKQWFDAQGNDITSLKDGTISFDLYRTTESVPEDAPRGNVTLTTNCTGASFDGKLESSYPIGTTLHCRVSYGAYSWWTGETNLTVNGRSLPSRIIPTTVNGQSDTIYYDFDIVVSANTPIDIQVYDPGSAYWQLEALSVTAPVNKANAKYLSSHVISASKNWTTTIKNLPKATVIDGKTVYYTYFVEETGMTGCTTEYVYSDDGIIIRNTTEEPAPEETKVTVTKLWKGNDNTPLGADSIPRDSIQVALYRKDLTTDVESEIRTATITPDENGNWQTVFDGLLKSDNYVYYVKELTPVPGFTVIYEDEDGPSDGSVSAGNDESAVTVTNKELPDTLSFKAHKSWKDASGNTIENAPVDSITLQLYKKVDGIITEMTGEGSKLTLKRADGWQAASLPLRSRNEYGESITYYVKEIDCPDGYHVSYSSKQEAYFVGNEYVTLAMVEGDGITIEATNSQDTSFELTKDWKDKDNKTSIPSGAKATFQLYKSLANSEDYTPVGGEIKLPTETGEWTYTNNNLPSFENGSAVVYYIQETSHRDNFAVSYPGEVVEVEGIGKLAVIEGSGASLAVTITNKEIPPFNITVNKAWQNKDGTENPPPDAEVTLQLYQKKLGQTDEGTPYGEPVTLSTSTDWSHVFPNLPAVDPVTSERYVYHVVETGCTTEGYTASYQVTGAENGTVEISGEGGITVTNSPTETTDLYVHKTWEGYKDGELTIESVQVQLFKQVGYKVEPVLQNGSSVILTLTKGENWTGHFDNLPKTEVGGEEIVYFVQEVIEGSDPGFSVSYEPLANVTTSDGGTLGGTANGAGTQGKPIKITNKNDNVTEIRVNKQWFQNGKPVDKKKGSISFDLYRVSSPEKPVPGEATPVTYEVKNPWEGKTLSSGIVYGAEVGSTIEYTFEVDNAKPTDKPKQVTLSGAEYVKEGIAWDSESEPRVGTMTLKVTAADVKIDLGWNKSENILNSHVTCVTPAGKPVGSYTVSAGDWNTVIGDLPRWSVEDGQKVYYTYYVLETTAGYVPDYDNNTGIVEGSIAIKNTLGDSKNLSVNKIWKNKDNETYEPGENGTDADVQVNLKLYQTATKSGKTSAPVECDSVTLPIKDAQGNKHWTYTFEDLITKSADGTTYEYSVKEEPVPDGFGVNYLTNADGSITVTNKEQSDTTSFMVQKAWASDIAEADRPDSIRVALYRKVKSSGGGSGTGKGNVKFVGEQNQKDWTASSTTEVSRVDGWPIAIDKYNGDGFDVGTTVEYSIYVEGNGPAEFSLDKGTLTLQEHSDTNNYHRYTFKYTYVVQDTGDNVITATRNNGGNNHPTWRIDRVNTILPFTFEWVANYTIESAKEWKLNITSLPKYDENGNEIEYVIKEIDPGYKVEVTDPDENGLITVTNSKKPESTTTDIVALKEWQDATGKVVYPEDGREITVTLKRNGEVYTPNSAPDAAPEGFVNPQTVSEETEWKAEFKNLPKTDGSGKAYVYTVEETFPEGATWAGDYDAPVYTTEGGVITITNKEKDKTTQLTIHKDWKGVDGRTSIPALDDTVYFKLMACNLDEDKTKATEVKLEELYPDVLTRPKFIQQVPSNPELHGSYYIVMEFKPETEGGTRPSSMELTLTDLPAGKNYTVVELVQGADGSPTHLSDYTGWTVEVGDTTANTDGTGSTVNVTNKQKGVYELPATGGPGTRALYASGVLLLMLAVLLPARKRRRSRG